MRPLSVFRELDQRQNADAARALMLRGLRSCAHSQQLWVEYFRLELVYACRIRARRAVLGLEDPKAAAQVPPRSQSSTYPSSESSD